VCEYGEATAVPAIWMRRFSAPEWAEPLSKRMEVADFLSVWQAASHLRFWHTLMCLEPLRNPAVNGTIVGARRADQVGGGRFPPQKPGTR
jgi:hypothetical protein